MGFLVWITSTIGIYEVLYQIWTWLEAIELGMAYVSAVDTIICFFVSASLSFFMLNNF